MQRSPETTPTGLPTPESVNIALGVAEADAKILLEGLKEMGVSEKTLARLKKLDGLAKSNGHFLSVSLQTTHRMYFVQVVEMMGVAQEMKEHFLDFKPDPADPSKEITHCSTEERAWLYKCYTEMVKEAGKAYQTMMDGTEAMVRMMKAASGGDDKPQNGKPKWHQRTTKGVPPKKKS